MTLTSGKFAAMAHIDDNTIVDSIFAKFTENSVSFTDVKVIVLGGWKEHPESFKWGTKIVKKINEAGFEDVRTKNMHLKKALTVFQQIARHFFYQNLYLPLMQKTISNYASFMKNILVI